MYLAARGANITSFMASPDMDRAKSKIWRANSGSKINDPCFARGSCAVLRKRLRLDSDGLSLIFATMSVAREIRRRLHDDRSLAPFEPCLPRPAKEPPAGSDWIHEIIQKWRRQHVERLGTGALRRLDCIRDLFELGDSMNRKLNAVCPRQFLQHLEVLRRAHSDVGECRSFSPARATCDLRSWGEAD
jgi:hypothetical protein